MNKEMLGRGKCEIQICNASCMDGIGIRISNHEQSEQASAEHDKLRTALFNLRKCIRARTDLEPYDTSNRTRAKKEEQDQLLLGGGRKKNAR